MSQRTVDPSQVIPFREKFGYALGDFASNLFWMPFVYFGLFFYTDVFGLSSIAVGVMLSTTRFWDSVADPVMGAIADRTRPRPGLGRYRPFLFWFAIPFGLVAASAFYTPDLSHTLKLIYAWITYTAFCLVYTAINVPYSALMSVMSKEPSERNHASFFRMIGAQSGGLIIALFLKYLVTRVGGGEDQGSQQKGFFLVMAGFAVLAVASFLITGLLTRERVPPVEKPKGEMGKDLMTVITNPPWWILFGVSIFTIAAFNMRFGVAAYYFKYYSNAEAVKNWSLFGGLFRGLDGAISAFFTFNTIGGLLGVVAFSFIARKVEKRLMYVGLILVSGILSLAFNYIPNTSVTEAVALQGLFSFLTGPTGAILFSMYTDVSAHIRNETGLVADGFVMAAGSFAQKIGWTIGGSLTSFLIGYAGYVANQEQTAAVKDAMFFMMGYAPMIACVMGALFMLIYPLSDARMRVITQELAAKGLKADAEAAAT